MHPHFSGGTHHWISGPQGGVPGLAAFSIFWEVVRSWGAIPDPLSQEILEKRSPACRVLTNPPGDSDGH